MKSYGRRADLPDADRLRTGAFDRRRHRRRPRGGRAGRTGAARNRRLQPATRPRCQQLLRRPSHYRMLTRAASRMRKAKQQGKTGCGCASWKPQGVNGIFSGRDAPLSSRCAWGASRSLLLTRVVVPSILAGVPDSGVALSRRRAGRALLAGSGAAGYMLAVRGFWRRSPIARRAKILICRLGAQRPRHIAVRPVRHRPVVRLRYSTRSLARALQAPICRALKALTDRPAPRRSIPRHHALHVELLVRGRPVVSGVRSLLTRSLGAGAARSSSRPPDRW